MRLTIVAHHFWRVLAVVNYTLLFKAFGFRVVFEPSVEEQCVQKVFTPESYILQYEWLDGSTPDGSSNIKLYLDVESIVLDTPLVHNKGFELFSFEDTHTMDLCVTSDGNSAETALEVILSIYEENVNLEDGFSLGNVTASRDHPISSRRLLAVKKKVDEVAAARAVAELRATLEAEGGADCTQGESSDYGLGRNWQREVGLQNPRLLGAGESGPPPYYLLVAINSVPRTPARRYLSTVTQSILEQLPVSPADPLVGRVHFAVANFRPGQHPDWEASRAMVAATPAPAPSFFTFLEIEPNRCDPPRDPGFQFKVDLTPNAAVRQQTRDVVSMAARAAGNCEMVMFMEDDFVLCPHALLLLHMFAHRAAEKHPTMSGARVSFGMNGLLMRCADLPAFLRYLQPRQMNMPVDLLSQEWFLSMLPISRTYNRNQPFVMYRFNLLFHIGVISTFMGRAERTNPTCGALMKTSWSVKESFSLKECKSNDYSPCAHTGRVDHYLRYEARSRGAALLADDAEVMLAAPGLSCSEACARGAGSFTPFDVEGAVSRAGGAEVTGAATGRVGTCEAEGVAALNSCRELRRRFPCEMCLEDERQAAGAPGFYVEYAHPHTGDSLRNVCVLAPEDKANCRGASPSLLRACPCTPKYSHRRVRRAQSDQTCDQACVGVGMTCDSSPTALLPDPATVTSTSPLAGSANTNMDALSLMDCSSLLSHGALCSDCAVARRGSDPPPPLDGPGLAPVLPSIDGAGKCWVPSEAADFDCSARSAPATERLCPCRLYSDSDTPGAVSLRSGVQLHTALQGASCDAACATQGLRCDAAGIKDINNCDVLMDHFSCVSCGPSVGADQPCFVSEAAPANNLPGACLFNKLGASGCSGSHPLTTRLCTCIAP